MSGAEPLALLGAISSVIAIVEASQKIYEATKNVRGLHEAFAQVAENIPLVVAILKEAQMTQEQAAKDHANTKDVLKKKSIEDMSTALTPVMVSCSAKALALKEIFELATPKAGASRVERYAKAVQSATPGKQRKVEQLFKSILEKLQLLHQYEFFTSQARSAEVGAAIDRMSSVRSPSLESGTRSNLHYASGTPKNAEYSEDTPLEPDSDEDRALSRGGMTWNNYEGSKIINQGSQTIHGGQNITF